MSETLSVITACGYSAELLRRRGGTRMVEIRHGGRLRAVIGDEPSAVSFMEALCELPGDGHRAVVMAFAPHLIGMGGDLHAWRSGEAGR